MRFYKGDFIATFVTVLIGTLISSVIDVNWRTTVATALVVGIGTLLFRGFYNADKGRKSASVRRNGAE